MRLEKWLREKYPSLTRQQAREALEAGLVELGEGRPKKGTLLHGSSVVRTEALDQLLSRIRLGNADLRVQSVHEGADFWVVDKPAGIPSHPVHLADFNTVTHWAFSADPRLSDEFSAIQPTLTPHRLDTGTSGLLIVAKTVAAFNRWRGYFMDKKITKTYLAWCWGASAPATTIIESALSHHPSDKRKMVASSAENLEPGAQYARYARSEVTCEKASGEMALFRVFCKTGATHQVRVHLSSIGFPLIGDGLYDERYESRPWNPPHHQLRAVQMDTPEGSFSISSEGFRSLENRTLS